MIGNLLYTFLEGKPTLPNEMIVKPAEGIFLWYGWNDDAGVVDG